MKTPFNRFSPLLPILLLALAAPLRSDANPIIEWSNSVTQVNADGLGTFGDDPLDFYRVGLRAENITNPSILDDKCWRLEYDADLEDRRAFNFIDAFDFWTFDANGVGHDYFNTTTALPPGFADTFYYDVLVKDVLGWETATVRMYANSGASNEFEADVPITRHQKTSKGIPFGWLYDQGIVTSGGSAAYESGSLIDSDLDGFFNWEEYIADTGPNLSNSYFQVNCTVSNISWHSATGRVYSVWWTTNLQQTFQPLETNIHWTTSTYTNTSSHSPTYYKINVELE